MKDRTDVFFYFSGNTLYVRDVGSRHFLAEIERTLTKQKQKIMMVMSSQKTSQIIFSQAYTIITVTKTAQLAATQKLLKSLISEPRSWIISNVYKQQGRNRGDYLCI